MMVNYRKVGLKSVLVAGLLVSLAGCNGPGEINALTSPESAPSLIGSFASQTCFFNKLASAGNDSDVYSDATISLRADGTGTNKFVLYSNSDCSGEWASGEAAIRYEVARTVGSALVIRVDQENDPSDSSDILRYWLIASVEERGLLLDMDYRDGESGVYLTEPTDSEVQAFASKATSSLDLFKRL